LAFWKRGTVVYDGPVMFDGGHHYPVGDDGHKTGRKPLIRVVESDGTQFWRFGSLSEPHHNHVFERRIVELPLEERAQW
jgi:hypothetical protein